MPIEITYCIPSKDPASKNIAEFGIRIPEWDLTFVKLKLIKGMNDRQFIGTPSYKVQMEVGKDEFKAYWFFGDATKRKFTETVLKAINEYMDDDVDDTYTGIGTSLLS